MGIFADPPHEKILIKTDEGVVSVTPEQLRYAVAIAIEGATIVACHHLRIDRDDAAAIVYGIDNDLKWAGATVVSKSGRPIRCACKVDTQSFTDGQGQWTPPTTDTRKDMLELLSEIKLLDQLG